MNKKTKAKKQSEKEYRKTMTARQSYAIENARLRATEGGASPMHDKKSVQYSHTTDQLVGGKIEGTEVDANFASDLQKMKFCRKPVGFVMWLLYIVLLVALAAPFVLPKLQLNLGNIQPEQYVALCMETEPKQQAAPESEGTEEDAEGEEGEEGEEGDEAENAAYSAVKILGADEDEEGSEEETAGDDEEGEDAESGENGNASTAFSGTLYHWTDPLFGWIKFIAGKFNIDLNLGESPWYDAQVAKTEVGMADTLAPILILAFPPFIVIYALLALVLMFQTLICFASGDRRIFRFTGLENLIMLLCGAVVMVGCFATLTEVDAAMDFSKIVDFLIGGINETGGFTAGYGMFIMIGLPVVEFILSFFLLEKKLRGREITQPIVVYHYKEK